jgi:hypothetical protein
MAKMRVVAVVFACLVLVLFAGCFVKVGGSVGVPVEEKEQIAIFNRVDELLVGDLADTVTLRELKGGMRERKLWEWAPLQESIAGN